jgi:hypothetical protein
MSPEEQRRLGVLLLVPPKERADEWPWKWAPEGDAIVWRDGKTVLMREELQLIIESLIPSVVPRIGPLVLLLAACRGKVDPASFDSEFFQHHPDPAAARLEACRLFDELAGLPGELLSRATAKAALAELVFESAPKLAPRGVSSVLALLREGLPPSAWPDMPAYAWRGKITDELRMLHEGLVPLDAEKIAHALRTGIPESPRAADVDLPLGESVLALLHELENDEEFHGLARLARDVMAAVILPRAMPQPDHDSPGGFADIGNRGELHRLLLSELAHDDDTLAARVALGEALYLRREPAANPPAATLALLLDSGLRMWGTPRVFGAAVALACLAKTPPQQSALAFRASGAQAEPLTLSTRTGLTAHLAALDTPLNPAAALAPLAAKLRTSDSQLDIIVITHPLALEDADFNATCASQRDASIHAATVDRDGAFALHLRTPGGWQPLAGARLKLDALFASRSRRSAPRESATLPAMLRRERCVFLLPIPKKIRASCLLHRTVRGPKLVPDYSAGIAEDGSLWLWPDAAKHGAFREKSVRLAGALCALFFDSDTQCFIAVGYEPRGGRLNLLRRFGGRDEGETHVTELSAPIEMPVRGWAAGGHLFLGTDRQVHVINIASGAIVSGAMLPAGMRWLNSRCVIRTEAGVRHFMAVTFDGIQVVFQPLNQEYLLRNAVGVLHIVRRAGSEEMWVLDNEGRFFDADSGVLKFDTHLGPFKVLRISQDGQRLLVRDRHGLLKDISLSPTRITPSSENDTIFDGVPSPRPWSLRTKLSHIAAHPSGRVWLRATRGYWSAICLNERSRTFALERQPPDLQPPAPAAFGTPQEIAAHGCSLSLAELDGGGRAWLDSRGMLHLQAADLSIPEITVVLAENSALPVWCSDDAISGPEYFVGDRKPRPGDAEKIDGHLRAFAASCQ